MVVSSNDYYDEDTLFKVLDGIRAAGVDIDTATAAVAQMQNRGILFRERAATMPDTVSSRGFTFGPERAGTYGGSAQVYESSAASSPHVWVRVIEPKITQDADSGDVAVHLTVEDALRFAEDILRLCNNHYQTRDREQQQQ